MQGSLAGGVGAPHHEYLLIPAGSRLHQRRAIIDAAPGQTVPARNFEFAILHTRREQNDMTRNLASVSQLNEPVWSTDAQARRPLRDELRSKAGCLNVGAPSHIGPRNAGGKAEIVLDLRGGTRLSARRLRFHDQRS